jgi:diguanylate cyclase (GGDEF)-like protein
VPPELHKVAEEFNRMIGRIHDSEEALADLARRDGLTKLLNRRAFDDALAEAIARVQRLSEPIALLILDLDHFKRINDTHGHGVGDEVLRKVAEAMVADVRIFDRVFRVGGEELAVLLTGVDATAAETTAERLRQSIAAMSIPVAGGEIGASVSIGVALGSQSSEPASLVEAADKALYRAKAEGRNRVVVGAEASVAEPARG